MAKTQASTLLRQLCDLAAAQGTAALRDPQLLDRFTSGQEQAAFAALVRRHGPLVLGVCRRVLHHEQDAEDAFQATFLILARKAGSIGKRESLASWLYRVAYRVAVKARQANQRRREQQAGAEQPADPLDEVTGRELLAILDEELQRLPDRYRVPLVLCYLEGRTRDQAAGQLGWSLGTLKRRLEQGRDRLRTRLARRGVALSGALLAAGLSQGAATAAVPAALAASTVSAAVLVATGKAALAGMAAALAQAVLNGMFAAKLKMAAAVVLVLGIVGLGAGMLTHRALAPRQDNPHARTEGAPEHQARPDPVAAPKKQPAASAPQLAGPEDRRHLTVTGRVLGPDGKPIQGVQVAVVAQANGPRRGGDLSADDYQVLGQAKADGQGRFRLTAPRTSSVRFRSVFTVAGKEGYAIGWQELSPDAEQPEALIRLRPEQGIRGRLVDLQGQAAARARVAVSWVGKSVRGEPEGEGFFRPTWPSRFPFWPEPVTTDAQGRFMLHGLDHQLGVTVVILDDRFARQMLWLPGQGRKQEVRLALTPARIIEGRVRYADTGKPVASARLTVYASSSAGGGGFGMDALADGNGHFRINPAPGNYFNLTAYAPDGQAYLSMRKEIKWPRAAVKQQLELKLPRGILVQGQVTEVGSGKPVARASVQFIPRWANNTNLRDDVVTGWEGILLSGADGGFDIPVLPGPGHLLVHGPTPDYVLRQIGGEELSTGRPGGRRNYAHALVALDLKPRQPTHQVTVKLRRGVTVKGRLVTSDGKPVGDALMLSRLNIRPHSPEWRGFPVRVRDGRFELHGCDPETAVPVYFLDARNKLGAAVQLSGKQAGTPVTVRLAPCGSAALRVVHPDGRPAAGCRPALEIIVTPGPRYLDRKASARGQLAADADLVGNFDRLNHWDLSTDAQGRLTFPALIPGATYRMAKEEFKVEAGKTVKLPDMILK